MKGFVVFAFLVALLHLHFYFPASQASAPYWSKYLLSSIIRNKEVAEQLSKLPHTQEVAYTVLGPFMVEL